MTTPAIPSVEQLKRAVELAEQIAGLQDELDSILGRPSQSSPSSSSASSGTRGNAGAQRGGGRKSAARAAAGGKGARRRTMSPEAREKIAAAQRARWAKQKKDSSK